jgi:large subunit ribosomal protein L18
MEQSKKVAKRKRRHRRVRNKIVGTVERPRLAVFRSARHIYAQVIDDSNGRTLASASTLKLGPVKGDGKLGSKVVAAREVGKLLADAARKQGVEQVAFDRGGFLYHGRVAALAEGAREGGLKF